MRGLVAAAAVERGLAAATARLPVPGGSPTPRVAGASAGSGGDPPRRVRGEG